MSRNGGDPGWQLHYGLPLNELKRRKNESPQHRVDIHYQFAVAQFELTRGQFARFVNATKRPMAGKCDFFKNEKWLTDSSHNWQNPGFDQSDDHPVVCVNWYDARDYVLWLSQDTGKEYRLLTEAEWEYVARAGSKTAFGTGKTIHGGQANFNSDFAYLKTDKSASNSGQYIKRTVSVGQFPANPFGVYDLHGNVWEWLADCYYSDSYLQHDRYPKAAGGRAYSCHEVFRGGPWSNIPRYLRSALRYGGQSISRSNNRGFRVARTLSPERPSKARTRHRFDIPIRADGRQNITNLAAKSGDLAANSFRDCKNCPVMMRIPAGNYKMGSLSREQGRFKNESPVHRVTINYPFAVGKFEVLQAEWQAVMGKNPSDRKGHRHPVERVSWDDVQAFLNLLSQMTGKRYRLLSEAEWEYAARAGSTTRYFWGDRFSQDRVAKGQWHQPVGRNKPNLFGLHDMHGNVWEWVGDCWNENYRGAPSDGSARTGGDCSQHVLRGGSTDRPPRFLRSAKRKSASTSRGHFAYGFRVARTLPR